jgi:hypothetical protein
MVALLAYINTRLSTSARDLFGRVEGQRRRPHPPTLATTVPTYNPSYFARLPDTAATLATNEIHIPTT